VAVIVVGIFGMFVGNLTAGSAASSQATGTKGAAALPPPASATSGSTTPTTAGASAAGSASSTTTSLPSSTTTTTAATGPVTVLLGPYQSRGDWTSPSFTIAGGQWNIGWAFQCTPAPTAGPSFEVFVLAAGASAGAASVSETGGSGQSVTAQTTAGSQHLQVQAAANCVWVIKITGVG
jgi:hypothetical protein